MDRSQIKKINPHTEYIKANLYLVKIKFKGTSLDCSLSWKDLGFEGEELVQLQKTNSRITGITIFESLKEAASELQKLRREFEHNFVIVVNEQKVITDQNLEAALLFLSEMRTVADNLRSKIIKERAENIESLSERLNDILSNKTFNLYPWQVENKINEIVRKFPDEEDLENNYLRIETQVSQLESVLTQLERENKEQELKTLVMQQEARREFHQSQREAIERIKFIKQEIFKKAQEIVEEILLEQLEKFNDIEIGKPNKRIRNKIEKHLERLQAVMELDLSGDFSKISEQLEIFNQALSEEISNGKKHRLIEEKIQEIRLKLTESYQAIHQESLPQNNQQQYSAPIYRIA